MPREADGKLTTSSPGICHTLFRFFAKHFSFYASKTVTSGSRRSELSSKSVSREEDYEVAIEHVLIRNMQEEEKMRRKMKSEAHGREKKPSMAKKGSMTEELRLDSSIDEKSGSFIKKRKEVFFA